VKTEIADVAQAYDFCRRFARSHTDDFPVVFRFSAKLLRRHVAALYAFAGMSRDFSREPEESLRARRLEDWRRQLQAVGKAPPQHPVFLALETTLAELNIPREPFDDLLSAFTEDCGKKRYETFDDVLEHCRLRANPIGRIVLMIHGCRDEEVFRLCDRVCTALQLVSFLRNLSADLKDDRLYLPLEDFRECGYSEADLRMGLVNERFRNLVKLQWKRARTLFEEGRSLPSSLSWPLNWELRLRWFGGMEILRKIRKLDYDTIHRRPAVTAWGWAGLILKALAKR